MKNVLKRKRGSRFVAILMALCLLLAYIPVIATGTNDTAAGADAGLKVGAAMRDITPTDDMLPLHAGNPRMGLRLVGVIEGLNVRVIAMQNGDDPISLIVSVETGKGPYGPQFIGWLSEATGVAESNIFWSATHVHSAPEITSAEWEITEDVFNAETGKNEGRYENLRKWGYLVKDQLIAAAEEAIANMVQAEVGIGYTESYINVNRVARYVDAATGEVKYAEGFNGDGPVDKTLAVIEYRTMDTKEPIAYIMNYAMHLTSMYGNQYYLPEYASVNGFTEDELKRDETLLSDEDIVNNSGGVHPDIGGLVSDFVEAGHPGAVAIWTSGAAGNINPIFRNNMIYADPETGLKIDPTIPGASIETVEYYAAIQYADVRNAIASITRFESDAPITHTWGSTQLPNAEAGGDSIDMYLSVMRMGDITLAGHAGEIYNGIGVSMIEGAASEHTLVVNHCWTHEGEKTGYFPDDYSLETGSDKAASYQPGTINGAMSELLNSLYLEAEPHLTEGVTVKADSNSPTGYTATFVYKDAAAQNVRLLGDCMWFAKDDYEPADSLADGADGALYFGKMFTPYEWEKGMYPMHVQANPGNRYNNTKYYTEMKKVGEYWLVSIPLPSGAYKYCYYVDSELTTNAGGVTYIDTNTGTKVLDPMNTPLQNPISGNYANFSIVYMPFDPLKQDEDRSIELPIADAAKQGTVVFEQITGITTPDSNPTVDIGVYLPANYDDSGATEYKVFYLSHGGGGHERDWTGDGVMPNIMDHMIDEGRVAPNTIVVAVNFGGTGTGANNATVMQLVQRDYVIPLIESKYHASTKIEDRAYAGLSRGGRITADMMVNAANDSSFVQYGTWGVWAPQDVPTNNSEHPVGTEDKPVDVIRNLGPDAIAELNKLTIIVDTGLQDKRHFITGNALIEALHEMGVDVVKGLYPNGGHDWMCWPKNLEFFVDQLWEGK